MLVKLQNVMWSRARKEDQCSRSAARIIGAESGMCSFSWCRVRQLVFSLSGYILIYTFLTFVWIYLMKKNARLNPDEEVA